MKKITICGVPGSDNLGDAVIADCLVAYFERNSNVQAVKCDISYREDVIYDSVKGRSLNVFNRLPRFLRQLAVLFIFGLKYLRVGKSFLREKMSSADLVVVGGGQLISDVDWNFPFKLYLVAKMAERLDLPIQVAAVGVAGKWSWGGKWFMSKLLKSPKIQSIGVRDEKSRLNLVRYFDIDNAEVIPDPAVMCSLLIPVPELPDKKQIGIGVADLAGLNYSSDIVNDSAENGLENWDQLIHQLSDSDSTLILFTNGAQEDEQFLHEELAPYLRKMNRQFEIRERFQSSKEMIDFIASLSSLFAFRLHANIIAASYGVPHFAIGWDNKVISFFKMQNRQNCVFSSINDLVMTVQNQLDTLTFESSLTPESVMSLYTDYFENKA